MDRCEFCNEEDCHWSNHPEARADVAIWNRELEREHFPFGDHREDY